MPGDADTGLRVGVLGPLRAWRGTAEIGLGPARQRAIFAVLAVNAGRAVPRAELIAGVWGDSAPASVEGSVHTYVSGLRRALEPDRSRWSAASVLVSDPAGYSLLLGEDALDAAVFERRRESAQRHLDGGDPRAAVTELDAALALWQGEALSGVPGGFAERHREYLAELRLNTLERRAEALLALGGHLDLAPELAVLAGEHPLRESLRESLMLALYRSGRHADALDVFRDARATLINELGVEPGPALQRLQQQILAQDPALDAPAAPVVVTGHRLFGREAETTQLAELVADVRAGRGRAVWIEGDAGIGKSELLTSSLPDGPGFQRLWAAADELSTRFPLQVMLECLEIDVHSPDPRRARLAKELAGEGPVRRSWGPADPVLGAVDRLLALVDDLCAHSPQVLVIDDLQWADEASVLVWHRLCAATRQLPLLLVAATRPAPDRAELAQLRRGVHARDGVILDLTPLTGEDVGRLIEDQIGSPPGPGLRELAARGAGNPLYVKEMVDVLLRAGAVEVSGGEADVDDPGGVRSAAVAGRRGRPAARLPPRRDAGSAALGGAAGHGVRRRRHRRGARHPAVGPAGAAGRSRRGERPDRHRDAARLPPSPAAPGALRPAAGRDAGGAAPPGGRGARPDRRAGEARRRTARGRTGHSGRMGAGLARRCTTRRCRTGRR